MNYFVRGSEPEGKIAYEKILSGREVQLNKLVQSTANIYGTMQGILSESMPQIKGFDLLEIESGSR